MSNVMIGLFFGIGLGGWVYAKVQRSTGGNTTNSVAVAAGAGLLGFLAMLLFLELVVPKS